jgi:hypothetical protein
MLCKYVIPRYARTRNLYEARINDTTTDVFTDLVPVLCVDMLQETYITHRAVTAVEQEDIVYAPAIN